MEHGVGRTAQCHVDGLGVVEGGGGHNITGTDVLLHQFHDLHTGVLGKAQASRHHGGDRAVAGQGHTDGLGKAVHGVGGIHTGAGTAGGAGVILVLLHTGLIQLAGIVSAHRLKHMAEAGAATVIHRACQHGAAGAENGGHVDAGSRHQKSRHILIAVGDHHQTVELVCLRHGLGGVGDQITGDEGVFHTHMTHGDTVTHGDGGELHRRTACGADARLHRLGDLVQIHMTGDDLILRAHHADKGALQFFLGIAQRVQQ